MKKHLFALWVLLTGVLSAGAQWSIVGEFCGWNSATSPEMTEQADGSWTITMSSLQGPFKFQKDHWWDVNLGVEYQTIVYGNGTLPLKSNGVNLVATPSLSNVTITLYPEKKTVTFSGLSQNMEDVDYTKPMVTDLGCYLIFDVDENGRPDAGLEMEYNSSSSSDNSYTITRVLKGGSRFYISRALVSVPEGKEAEAWAKLREYEYIPAVVTEEMMSAGAAILIPGQHTNLQTPNPYDLCWQVPKDGTYEIEIDLDAKTMMVEEKDPVIYVVGHVENPVTGVKNNFTSPDLGYQQFYKENFSLEKITDDVFQGEFIVYSESDQPFFSIDNYPQIRFYSDLSGWGSGASLGSAKSDFYVLPIELTEGTVTLPIVEGGMGNWGFHDGEYWKDQLVEMTVDLKEMMVTFALSDANSVEKINPDESDAIFYNLQGERVFTPTHGVFIRVTSSGAEKIRL